MKKTISVIASLVIASSMMFTSCKPKESDKVNPTQVVNPVDTTKHTVDTTKTTNGKYVEATAKTSTPSSLVNVSGSFTVKASDLVNVGSMKSLKFISLPTSSYGTFVFTNTGDSVITFTPSSMYYGNASMSFDITDGKTPNTFTYSGSIGTTAQIATYSILSPMFGKLGSASTPTNLKFNSDMTMSSSANTDFYANMNSTTTGGTFTIKTNGQLLITDKSGTSTFTVSLDGNTIYFLKGTKYFQIVK